MNLFMILKIKYLKEGRFFRARWGLLLFWILIPAPVRGSVDLDRQFKLESVGVLRSLDNVDGVFAEYIGEAFGSYLKQPGRFLFVDLKAVDSILSRSQLPYDKAVFDLDILKQAALKTRADSLIRTRVQKLGARYFFKLEWLHAPRMEVLSEVDFDLEEPSKGGGFEKDLLEPKLQLELSKLVHQIPFFGQVTGRDRQSVTLNIGTEEGLKVGDQIELATIEEARRHPMMNRVVDWKMRPTGRVIVESLEAGMTFCRLVSEEPGFEVTRFQKVIRIDRSARQLEKPEMSGVDQEELRAESYRESSRQTLGWASLSLPLGLYSRSYTANSGAVSNQGGGLSYGVVADGQLWLNRSWFLNLRIGEQLWTFTQTDQTGSKTAASSTGGVAGSVLNSWLTLGYAVHFTNDFNGPHGWVKLGFKSDSTQLPSSSSEGTGPLSLSSVGIGVGGLYPFREKWEAFADIKLSLLTIGSYDSSSISKGSDLNVVVGGTYALGSQLKARGTIEYQTSSVSLSNGTSITQNWVTIGPSVQYSF